MKPKYAFLCAPLALPINGTERESGLADSHHRVESFFTVPPITLNYIGPTGSEFGRRVASAGDVIGTLWKASHS